MVEFHAGESIAVQAPDTKMKNSSVAGPADAGKQQQRKQHAGGRLRDQRALDQALRGR